MPPSPPPLMAGLLTRTLEGAIGAYLALDENHRELLEPLAGKAIALRLRPLDATVFLCPTDTTVQVLAEIAGRPDVTLSGTVSAFARMVVGDAAQERVAAGEIEMEGDTDVARRFRDLFEGLNIDWEARLTRHTGRGFAASVVDVVGIAHTWARGSMDALCTDLAEYWQEESKELPTGSETRAFLSAVDTLRGDCDRLEARIGRLEKRLGASPTADRSPARS